MPAPEECENSPFGFNAALPPDLRKAYGFPAGCKPSSLKFFFLIDPERLSLSASRSGRASSFHTRSQRVRLERCP